MHFYFTNSFKEALWMIMRNPLHELSINVESSTMICTSPAYNQLAGFLIFGETCSINNLMYFRTARCQSVGLLIL